MLPGVKMYIAKDIKTEGVVVVYRYVVDESGKTQMPPTLLNLVQLYQRGLGLNVLFQKCLCIEKVKNSLLVVLEEI